MSAATKAVVLRGVGEAPRNTCRLRSSLCEDESPLARRRRSCSAGNLDGFAIHYALKGGSSARVEYDTCLGAEAMGELMVHD